MGVTFINPFMHLPGLGTPSPGLDYLTTVSDTTDTTTYTFSSIDVGPASVHRRIYAFVNLASASTITITSVTIGGVTAQEVVRSMGGSGVALYMADVPDDSSISVIVTLGVTGTRCRVSLYRTYYENTCIIDWGSGSGAGVTLSDLEVKAGGFLIAGSYLGTAGDITHAWSGVDSFVEDLDSTLETSNETACGHIITTENALTNDLVESRPSGSLASVAATFENASETPPVMQFRRATSNANSLTTYTFSPMPFGKADPARMVAIGLNWRDGATVTISSATIGGVAASVAVQTSNTTGGAAIIYAIVPTGDFGDVSVTLSGSVDSLAAASWRGKPASTTPLDTASNIAASGSSLTASNIDVAAGGFLLACGHVRGAQNVTVTYNGVDTIAEDADFAVNSSERWFASCITTETVGTNDVTATTSNSFARSVVAASWV